MKMRRIALLMSFLCALTFGCSGENDIQGEAKSAQGEKRSAGTDIPTLLDLGRTFCIPCKMMAPILEDLKKEYAGRLRVEFIDVGDRPEEARKYRIRLIPTQIFLDGSGKEIFRHEGFMSKADILAQWKSLGIDL